MRIFHKFVEIIIDSPLQVMLKKVIVLYGLLLIYFNTPGQPQALKHVGVEDGLSNNYIVDIIQDGQGFIWIATESGLSRFDGKNFTVYTKKNSNIVSNELNTLLYDQEENKIWIGSQRDGISIFDCASQSFTDYTVVEGLITNDVTHLSHAEDGGIWITHYHVGIEYYDKNTKQLTRFLSSDIEGLELPNWCSFDDGKGNLYVGHAFDGLSIIDIKNKTARNIRHQPGNPKSLPGNTVRTIYMDSQKNIWIGTNEGLALFNPQTDEFITFRHNPSDPNSLGANYIYDIREMKDATLWISTDMEGISILDLSNITLLDPKMVTFKNISVTKNHYGLSSSNVRSLFQDSYDNIWIGHYSRGIDFIGNKPPVFQTLLHSTDKYRDTNERQIWDIYMDRDQQLWVGSENEVIVLQDNEIKRTINIQPYLSGISSNVYINKIKSDRNGILWLGSTTGDIFQLNPDNYQIKNIPFEGRGEYVREFYEDLNGKIWIGTENGLYSYRSGKIEKENHINDQLEDKIIYNILRDRQGKLWIGTFGKGIFIFDNNDNLVDNIVADKGFISNAIHHLYMDSEGGVWAATRNGMAYFNNTTVTGQYEIYDEKQGLENSYIRAIQQDNRGNIWISTNAGISLWDGEQFKNYNYQDGTPIGDFTNGAACLKDDGTVFFGSLNGVCYFNPEELTKEKRQVVPVQIIECLALNKQIENYNREILVPTAQHRIELPYDKNSFRISFSSPDHSQNQQVEYAYMMEGLDNTWYNTQDENQVAFRNISPGEYTFKVKSRLKNQEWDEVNIASMNFIIHPPLWLTWYAKLLYVVTVCIIILYLLRSYKKSVDLRTSLELERKNSQNKQELNDERLRFYTNITHELRTPLTLILGPLEDLVQDSGLAPVYSKKIGLIHASAIRLLNLINQILEFRKTETQNKKLSVSKGNLANLVAEIGLRYKELSRKDKVGIHIDIDDKNRILYFDADVITTILNNLLSNAMKYTVEGEIRLSLRSITEKDNHYAEISVSDTGYGIDTDALSHIFERYYQAKGKHQSSGTGIGLALVKSLVDLHEGILDVESTVGKGTLFRFRLLTKNTYPSANHAEEKTVDDIVEEDQDIQREESADNHPVTLIVEDDDDIRGYIATSLENDYHVLSATNGKEGLNLARKHIPDIIVSDIMMPEMDGMELCHTIKEDMRTSHIPVILLTAKDSLSDQEKGYDSGADSYLTKPFSARLLRSRIENLLESRRKLAEQISTFAKGIVRHDNNLAEEPITISKLDEEFLNKLTEIVENNIEMEDLDIAFIKEKMHMSYSTFYRKVKGLTGITPNEFIRKIRLKNSLKLLLSGSYQISEVAYMSGFNDVVYFRKCFKDEYGMAPSEYAKSVK